MTPIRPLSIALLGLVPLTAQADLIRFATPAQWQEWSLPGNAVEVTSATGVVPVRVRKDIDAVVDAVARGGGIRDVGSNADQAPAVMDNDPTTGWAPAAGASDDEAFIEIDLGRVVTAEQILVHMDEGAPPFEFVKVLVSQGEKFFNISDAPIEGSRVISYTRSFGFNDDHRLDAEFPRGAARYVRIEIGQPRRADPTSRIVGIEVRSVGDNVGLGLIERGGSIELITDLEEGTSLTGADRMVDGDITTVWFLNTLHQTTTGSDIFNQVIFDLGAHYWLDRIRVVGEPFHVKPSGRQRSGNFYWYTIFGSDGSTAPDGSLLWKPIAELPHDPANTTEVRNFEHVFPLEKVRYLRHLYPSTDSGETGITGSTHSVFQFFGLIGEFMMFGEGYPAAVTLESPILDFGGLRAATTLDWESVTPPGTRVEIRSRTGNELIEETLYFDKGGKQITERQYTRTPKPLRGETQTLRAIGDDWSAWSAPYQEAGDAFRSPSPRRYGQLQVRLLSDDPDAAASISSLSLNVESPIALQTRGEIHPRQTVPGEEGEFTYYMRPTFGGESEGYDSISLTASVPVEFTGLRVGDLPVAPDLTPIDGGFRLQLPQEVRTADLVEVSFRSTVYQNRTRFDLFLGNSRLDNVRQLVDEGDASDVIDSESVAITLPVNADLLANLELSGRVLTPNGDGIGDQLQVDFDALKLLTPRPVQVVLHDLTGRRLRNLSPLPGLAQHYTVTWDGRNSSGDLVPPGVYVLRLEVEGDSRSQTVQRLVSVAY